MLYEKTDICKSDIPAFLLAATEALVLQVVIIVVYDGNFFRFWDYCQYIFIESGRFSFYFTHVISDTDDTDANDATNADAADTADADAVTPSSNTRSYTRRSVPSSLDANI